MNLLNSIQILRVMRYGYRFCVEQEGIVARIGELQRVYADPNSIDLLHKRRQIILTIETLRIRSSDWDFNNYDEVKIYYSIIPEGAFI